MRLNRKPLEEVDFFKYIGLQVAACGECERNVVLIMNKAWGERKSVLSNRGLGINVKK